MLTAPEGTGSLLQQPSMPAKDLIQGGGGAGSKKRSVEETALGWRAPCLNTTVSLLHSTARHTIPHHTKAHTAPTSHPLRKSRPSSCACAFLPPMSPNCPSALDLRFVEGDGC